MTFTPDNLPFPEAAIEAAARAIHAFRQKRGFGGKADWKYEPRGIRELHRSTARASLAAFFNAMEKEGKAREGRFWTAPRDGSPADPTLGWNASTIESPRSYETFPAYILKLEPQT